MTPYELLPKFKVLLQWKSTSVHTSWTYSTNHPELALGTFMRHFVSARLVCHAYCEKISLIRIRTFTVPDSRGVSISPLWRPLCRGSKQTTRAGQRLRNRLYFFEINRKHAAGNSVMSLLLHWYCHRGFGCGKMITFTLKSFNIFGDVYTRDGPSHFVKCTERYES